MAKRPPRPLRWIGRGYYWLTERLYNELACFYDMASWIVSLGQWENWRKCAINFISGPEVLEIGFGTGQLLLELAHSEIHSYGLELSKAMHRITRNKLHRRGIRVPLIMGMTQRMPFANDSFDTILSTFPAGYIFDPDTWREIARLLREPKAASQTRGGRFVVVGSYVTYTGKLHLPDAQSLYEFSSNDILTHITQLAQSVHLTTHLANQHYAFYDLSIIIAQKER